MAQLRQRGEDHCNELETMKEHPILFSAPMVRAILEGRKTQTRRIVKPQPWGDGEYRTAPQGCAKVRWVEEAQEWWFTPADVEDYDPSPYSYMAKTCPYGVVGDHLWVRETWAHFNLWVPGPSGFGKICYRADGDLRGASGPQGKPDRWRPSIHMPRWACRITLEVTDVRVERLQDISEEDARAEGVMLKGTSRYDGEARDAFEALWCSINGAESWDANPWCWCISFKVISPKA